MKISVVGMDPSLCNWGIVAGTYDTDTKVVHFTETLLITTDKGMSNSKSVSVDNMARARHLHRTVQEFIERHNPKALFAEVPTGSKSASSMKSIGICIGILGSLPDIIGVTPVELKRCISGRNSASKSEIITTVIEGHPELDVPRAKSGRILSKAEHICDAAAAVKTGIAKPEFGRIVQLLS